MSKARDLADFGDDISDGVISATLAGDGSAITNLPVSPSGVQTFTASGNISAGDLLNLNTDGTVSPLRAIEEESVAIPSGLVSKYAWAYDKTNSKVVIVGNDASGNLAAVIGSVSNGSITFGTVAIVSGYLNYGHVDVAFDESTGGLLICFRRHLSPYGCHVVAATVSGTTITFGSPTLVSNVNSQQIRIASNNSGQYLIAYLEYNSNYYAKLFACTVSGTSVTVGSGVQYTSNSYAQGVNVAYDPTSGYYLHTYAYDGDTFATPILRAVGVSGTSVTTYGSTQLNSVVPTSMAVDTTNNQFILVGVKRSPTIDYRPHVLTATLSGTTISVTSPVVLSEVVSTGSLDDSHSPSVSVDGSAVAFTYTSGASSRFTKGGTATLGSITLGGEDLPLSVYSQYGRLLNTDVAGRFFYVPYTSVIRINPQGSTASSWVGYASDNATDGSDAGVVVAGGVAQNLSGLTQGSKYLINKLTGALEESITSYDLVGLSSTSGLLLQNNTKGSSIVKIGEITLTSNASGFSFTNLDLKGFSAISISCLCYQSSYGVPYLTNTSNEIGESGNYSFTALVILDGRTYATQKKNYVNLSTPHGVTEQSTSIYIGTNTGYFVAPTNIQVYGVV